MALGVAATLARRGRRVLLVDCDTCAPVHHHWLGMAAAPLVRGTGIGDPEAGLVDHLRETPTDSLTLLSLAHARGYPWVRPRLDALSLVERLDALAFDSVIIDLPAGCDPVFAAIFSLVDVPVLVARTDRVSVGSATQFLRAALFHGIGFHPDCYDAEEDLRYLLREQDLHLDRSSLDPPYLSSTGRRVVRETQRNFVPNLVLTGGDRDRDPRYAQCLCLAWQHLLGTHPRPLAIVGERVRSGSELEEAVEWSRPVADVLFEPDRHWARYPRPVDDPHTAPALVGLSSSAPPEAVRLELSVVAQALEEYPERFAAILDAEAFTKVHRAVTKTLEDLEAQDAAEELPPDPPLPEVVVPEPPPEEVMELHAPDSEVEMFTEPPPAVPTAEPQPGPEPDTAQPPENGPPPRPSGPPPRPPGPPPRPPEAPRPPLPDHPPPDDQAGNPGAELRELRRARGMSLRELSLRTKIGVKYLSALEQMDKTTLPRPVYLRGYLREVARVFQVDESKLIARYFAYLGYP
jgi:flagellar biosynthesis protein FlhG